MSTKYTHLELDKDYSSISGYYIPEKEVRLKYNGREVLYVIGQAVAECGACCGAGSYGYTIVPGYIVNWQNTKNEAGLPVSEVESISDAEARGNIKRVIQANEATSPVGFW